MTIGQIATDGPVIQPTQTQQQPEVRQEDEQQRQAEQETVQQASTNVPDPNARVGTVIDTQV